MPIQCASAVSNIDTNTSPTSCRAHSSKTSMRNRPYCLGPDRAVGDEVALLPVQRPVARRGAPARLGQRQQLGGHPLDDRDELHERRAELVAQERVDLAPVVAVGRVDRGQRVPLHPVPLQRLQPAHDPVEGRLAALVDPVGVVHLARPVDRDPDEEVVLLEERAPLVVEQGRVGLHRVEDPLPGRGEAPLQLQGARGRSRGPSASARRPGRRRPPRRRRAGRRAAGRCTPRARPAASGSRCPGTARPWTGRSSTRSRGCRSHRSAWTSRGRPAAPSVAVIAGPSSGAGSHVVMRSVEDEPPSHLGLVVDVTLAGDVDDHLVDGATGEREGRGVGGRHRGGVVAAHAQPVADQRRTRPAG